MEGIVIIRNFFVCMLLSPIVITASAEMPEPIASYFAEGPVPAFTGTKSGYDSALKELRTIALSEKNSTKAAFLKNCTI